MPIHSTGLEDLHRTIEYYLADDTTSRQFRIFLKSRFFNSPRNVEYETLPPINADAVHWLEGIERDIAEDLLINHALLGDIHSLIGLREMNSEKAIEPIHAVLEENNSTVAYTAEAALTLYELTHDLTVSDYIVYACKRVGVKAHAVRILRNFPTEFVIGNLREWLYHEDPIIVAEVFCTLMVLYGETNEAELENRVEILHLLIRHDDDFREVARATINAIIETVPIKTLRDLKDSAPYR